MAVVVAVGPEAPVAVVAPEVVAAVVVEAASVVPDLRVSRRP